MEEKKEIKDAEIIGEEKKDVRLIKGIDFRLELALFLILGFLLGVVIKTEAAKRITIGFNDSAIPSSKQAYDFAKTEKELVEQAVEAAAASSSKPSSDSRESVPDNSNQNNN